LNYSPADLEAFAEIAAAGDKIPAAVENPPEVSPENFEYLDAFWTLNRSRTMGFEVCGHIPLTEIEAFCRIFSVSDPETLVAIVLHLDRLFVDFQNKKLKAKAKG
jgi:hypothetical protein